jgi:hypothetical protein
MPRGKYASILHTFIAHLSSPVETSENIQLPRTTSCGTENPCVVGSIPTLPTIKINHLNINHQPSLKCRGIFCYRDVVEKSF